jgi:hypothetical protein
MKIKFIILLLFSGFLIIRLNAQEASVATGGNISGYNGSVSYSVGQVANLYLESPDGSVVQGVQQPYEIFLITGIVEAKGVSLDFLVYPNPVHDFLKLKIQGLDAKTLVWKIQDSSGRVLDSGQVSDTETIISMTGYPAGIYLFSVADKNNIQYKTYQIIKN